MTLSPSGIALIKMFEQCRFTAYQDSGGIWTIGWGHTKGVTKGMTCTQAQADAWFVQDTQWAVDEVNRVVKVSLTQGEFDALVDFTFNVGAGNLEDSTLLIMLNDGDYDGAANQLIAWDHVHGAVIAGLLRRRLAERADFKGDSNGQNPTA